MSAVHYDVIDGRCVECGEMFEPFAAFDIIEGGRRNGATAERSAGT